MIDSAPVALAESAQPGDRQIWPEAFPPAWIQTLSQRYGHRFTRAEALHRGENACWLLSNLPTRLDIPELSNPAEVCTRYLKRLEGLLGPV